MIREIDWEDIKFQFEDNYRQPFRHAVIDNFFIPAVADRLSEEFPDYNTPNMAFYNNAIENKKALNQWDKFPPTTYSALMTLGSYPFIAHMQGLVDDSQLMYDFGLNGGGWHMHAAGGELNVHLDYNLHPKLGMQRKLNIIIYLTKDWNPEWGGGLELWSHNSETKQPNRLWKTVENKFNRAVIFDTTEDSWHGLPKNLTCPEGVYRKSLAAYYVRPAPGITEERKKALFAPREDQKNDPAVKELIARRSNLQTSENAYKG